MLARREPFSRSVGDAEDAVTARRAAPRGIWPNIVCFAVAALAVLFAGAVQAQNDSSPPARQLIAGTVNDSDTITLAGNTRREANAANDRGRVADSYALSHVLLQLRRPPERERALSALIEELHNPASPNFHRWLSAGEIGARFGLAAADISRVVGWLQQQGFRINQVYPNDTVIDFAGTAGQIRAAFRTEIHHLLVNGVRHIANMSDPKIPAALAPAVIGIVALNDFSPRPQHKMRPQYTVGSGTYLMVPADLATIYNINPLFSAGITGTGQTIYVVEDTNLYSSSDWTTFRSTFHLTNYAGASLTTVHPGSCPSPGVNADDFEAILDAEWASAAAPSAAIVVASCSTSSGGVFLAAQNLINASNPPAIVSVSYGACEANLGASNNAYINALWQQGAAEGVSIFVSTGDSNAAGCDQNTRIATHGINVNGLGSTQYNVAVGGTDFGDTYAGTNSTYWNSINQSDYGSAKSYVPEIPWNDSCASTLIAHFVGYAQTYGSSGFCNSASGANFLAPVGGSGGPSQCATGSPSLSSVANSGSCQGYAKPSWQTGVAGIPNDGLRGLPDVSLFAANGIWGHYYVVCDSDTANGGTSCSGAPSNWSGGGGTSFAAPILAGVQALINQDMGSRQGNPNPVYYKLAAVQYAGSGNSCNSSNGNAVGSACIFYDVTQGDMDVPCSPDGGTLVNCYRPSGTYGVLSTNGNAYAPAYAATAGWDFATGLGTINAYNLVTGWKSSNGGQTPSCTLTANPPTINPGQSSLLSWSSVNATGGTISPTVGAVGPNGSTNVSPTVTTTYTGTFTGTGGQANCTSATVTVIAPSTATSLTSSPNPSTYGQSVTFTATVSSSGGTPTGSVTFNDGGSALGSGPLSGGTATFSTSALSAGDHSITAVYGGDGTFAGSTSAPLTQTVNSVTYYTITTGVSPSVGGTAIGGGSYAAGSSRTVVATPSSGYGFADWTENGGFVSASASYSFTLNSNRNLVANFYNNGGGASLATYVNAQTGSDSGTCPETAPCATLNYALSVTGAGGVITILSGDSFGPIVIDGSLTIIGPPDGSAEILADPNATVGCLGALPANCGFANSGYAVQIAAGTGDNVTIANMSINAGATGSGGVLVSSGGTVILRNDEISGN